MQLKSNIYIYIYFTQELVILFIYQESSSKFTTRYSFTNKDHTFTIVHKDILSLMKLVLIQVHLIEVLSREKATRGVPVLRVKAAHPN